MYMKSTQTIDQMWMNTIEALLNCENKELSRVGEVKEMLAYTATLTNIEATFLLNKRRKLSPSYACAEFLWYLRHTKNIEMIKAYAPQYHRFAENDEAFGAYGWRLYENQTKLHNVSQLKMLIDHLTVTPNSRQAIVTLWEADDLYYANMKNHKDIPCTLSLQFLVREDKLHLIATMRSNDAWLGLPYDVFAFTCLQRLVADALGHDYGSYTHQVGSMHLYEKNWKAAGEALNSCNYSVDDWSLKHGWPRCEQSWQSQVQLALCAEGRYRNDLYKVSEHNELTGMLYDLVSCCSHRFRFKKIVYSPVLRKAVKNSKLKGEKQC